MLIFTRRIGEKVIINGDIIITAVKSDRDNQIKIGIEAPEYVSIDRHEIHEKKTTCQDSIAELNLSREINLLLANHDIYTIGELASLSFIDLLILGGMSFETAETIMGAYKEYHRGRKFNE